MKMKVSSNNKKEKEKVALIITIVDGEASQERKNLGERRASENICNKFSFWVFLIYRERCAADERERPPHICTEYVKKWLDLSTWTGHLADNKRKATTAARRRLLLLLQKEYALVSRVFDKRERGRRRRWMRVLLVGRLISYFPFPSLSLLYLTMREELLFPSHDLGWHRARSDEHSTGGAERSSSTAAAAALLCYFVHHYRIYIRWPQFDDFS